MVGMFDAQQAIEALQEAVEGGDREYLADAVSDRMIWVMPSSDNHRGKHEWIEASCGVSWLWFEVTVLRVVPLGDTIAVESWIRQSRDPVSGEDLSQPVTAEGVVLDVWVDENGTWRLAARHPQRASE
jgi:ketosteroid isomerase-like protein